MIHCFTTSKLYLPNYPDVDQPSDQLGEVNLDSFTPNLSNMQQLYHGFNQHLPFPTQ